MTAFRSSSNAMRDFIDNCAACERLCLEAVVYCRTLGGEFADEARLSMLATCAGVCRDAVSATQGSSEAQPGVLLAYASTCERAAKFCADFPEDKLLRACTNACRNAARSCAEMANLGGD